MVVGVGDHFQSWTTLEKTGMWREVSKHKALGQAQNTTDRGTVAKTGDQSPGEWEAAAMARHVAGSHLMTRAGALPALN